MKKLLFALMALFALATAAPALAQQAMSPEIGFSPEGTAYPLVMRVIGSATQSLHVMAYEMKDAGIMRALEQKSDQGVDVTVEVDWRENLGPGSTDYTRRRLAQLATSRVHVCAVSAYPVFHDKVIIADGRTVEFGSFNFTRAAKESNSENAAVFWNRPDVARVYEQHFESRLSVCQAYAG